MADEEFEYRNPPLFPRFSDMTDILVSCVEEDKTHCRNLREALDMYHVTCIKQVINQGLDVNQYYGVCAGGPLLLQAIVRDMEELVDLLLRHPNIDINVQNNFGENALFLAFKSTVLSYTFVLDLIKRGLDINAQDEDGKTALHYAVSHGDPEIVHTLLYYGADVSIACFGGYTPFYWALQWDNDRADILIHYYDFRYEDLKCFENDVNVFFYVLRHNYTAVFDTLWRRFSFKDNFMGYFKYFILKFLFHIRCSKSQWIRDFYLIFQSRRVQNFVPCSTEDAGIYPNRSDIADCKVPYCHFVQALMSALNERKIDREDRMSLIYVVLSWGIDVCLHSFSKTLELYGFGEELEALLYAGDYSGMHVNWNWNAIQLHELPHPQPLAMRCHLLNFFLPTFILGLETDTSLKNFISLFRKEYQLDYYSRYRTEILNCLRYFTLPADVTQKILIWCKNTVVDESELSETLISNLQHASGLSSLFELSRNAVRKYLKVKYKIAYAYQFHDVIKKLPLPEKIKNVISFKDPLYLY